MTMKDMYKGQVNSPETKIASAINSSTDTVTVLDGDILPLPPNLLVIGGDTDNPETVRMTNKVGNVLTVERAFQGEAQNWGANTVIGRNFTAYDYNTLVENVELTDNELKFSQGEMYKWEKRELTVFNDNVISEMNDYVGLILSVTVGNIPYKEGDEFTIELYNNNLLLDERTIMVEVNEMLEGIGYMEMGVEEPEYVFMNNAPFGEPNTWTIGYTEEFDKVIIEEAGLGEIIEILYSEDIDEYPINGGLGDYHYRQIVKPFIQSDWNENDIMSESFIKNKTHYIGEINILRENHPIIVYNSNLPYDTNVSFKDGDEYKDIFRYIGNLSDSNTPVTFKSTDTNGNILYEYTGAFQYNGEELYLNMKSTDVSSGDDWSLYVNENGNFLKFKIMNTNLWSNRIPVLIHEKHIPIDLDYLPYEIRTLPYNVRNLGLRKEVNINGNDLINSYGSLTLDLNSPTLKGLNVHVKPDKDIVFSVINAFNTNDTIGLYTIPIKVIYEVGDTFYDFNLGPYKMEWTGGEKPYFKSPNKTYIFNVYGVGTARDTTYHVHLINPDESPHINLETYTEKLQATTGVIDLTLANVFTDTPTANRTYSITNATSGVSHSFTLIIDMGATVRTLTFPASIKWQGGEIPDMTTASKTYVLTFMTVDGGTTWLGMFGGEF